MQKNRKNERSKDQPQFSIMWRNMLLMLILLGLFLIVLSVYHHISLEDLTASKIDQLQLSLKHNCAILANKMYSTNSLATTITTSRYYDYIRGERDGNLSIESYPVLTFLQNSLQTQVGLQGSFSSVTLLYFRNCNSIVSTSGIYPIAEKCFPNGISFSEIDSSVVLAYIKSNDLMTLLPMQRVSVIDQTKDRLSLIIHPTGSSITIMTLYTKEDILDGLGYDVLPEGSYFQITANDGQILMQYPSALPDQAHSGYLSLTAPFDPLRANVTIWVPKDAFSAQLEHAHQLGVWLTLMVAVFGLGACYLISRISINPIRQLISDHKDSDIATTPNEILSLGTILDQTKNRIEGLESALVGSLLAKAFSGGAILSEADEQILRKSAFPENQEYRVAILTSDPETNMVLGPRLSEKIPGLVYTILNPTEIGVVFSGREPLLQDILSGENQNIHCGISAPFAELSHLITAVRQARFSVPPQPGTNLFQGDRIQGHIYSRLQHERLYQYLFAYDEKNAGMMLDNIAQQLSLSNVREVFYNVRFTLRSAAEEMELDTGIFDLEYSPSKTPNDNMDILRNMLHRMFALIRKKSEGGISSRQEEILNWLRDNAYNSELCAASAAAQFGITEKKVYELVRNATNMSLNEYLLALRMRKAGKLLYSTQLSVGEIAVQCGYLAESTFYRVFKKYYGITPIQYRQTGTLPENE